MHQNFKTKMMLMCRFDCTGLSPLFYTLPCLPPRVPREVFGEGMSGAELRTNLPNQSIPHGNPAHSYLYCKPPIHVVEGITSGAFWCKSLTKNPKQFVPPRATGLASLTEPGRD
jgi:hypothetical protein